MNVVPAELLHALDLPALVRVAEHLGLNLEGSLNAQRRQIGEAVESVDQLLGLLPREDLVAMIRYTWFEWDERIAHPTGFANASMDDLRAAVKTFHVAEWSVPRKKTTAIPGTSLTLCWTDAGAPHPDSCDEHALEAPTAGDFSKDAIYTIIAPARFYGAPHEGLVFTEKKLWTKAAMLLRQAQADNTRLVLIFADATYCSRLLGWTTIESIELGEITTVRTGALVPLRRARRDSIVKSSDGVPLSTNYIRPYVLCELPSFLEGAPKPPASTARAQPLLAFTWGYKGWGPYTKELVELTDAVEARRGFAPPLWVDIRYGRVVRAPGF